ncbi:MAG TPA: PEP/pyruvate-binding domain-containing protein [Bacillota bacterium]|jgi:hypothetical protein|nr:PEP/pyruvate-binding domain-containing protein [Peptococcaceae bacterium MAG4]NLW38164.1 pyruvate kinase [Peptococcaceae bacterium]HPZ42871.1 PEP/pyruvate-binding domain-containing protein [Bacillota bacterium]HQD75436.1 PEP/pyruvate-binding domain-containing protein [Bacillota bacterium]HUM58187.1 PEP/pyruvate-binding domain-containing protein [Bacillota bacterium]
MGMHDKVSTGLKGLDRVIDMLRLGDNVVWQVDSIADYKHVVAPFVEQARRDGRKLIYVRFGRHEALLDDTSVVKVWPLEAGEGFESFATNVRHLIALEGRKAFYVFDCLSELLRFWHSDLMIGNFFQVTCPLLYELNTIAYFALFRNAHNYSTIARIRETTQLLLDIYSVKGNYYIHPLKAWQRYSPTMFLPHLIDGQDAICITSSAHASELFSSYSWSSKKMDYWEVAFQKSREALELSQEQQEAQKELLLPLLIGKESRLYALCQKYFSLEDVLQIASRVIGTGFIGGKSVGMLLARKILKKERGERFIPFLEEHDSFYLGSDIYYTYIVQNGCWELRTKQKTREGYFKYAPELREKLLKGKFPEMIQEQLQYMLEYFGQSPIIVRSSSLLEDNYGNAFAGKYESVFCVNQGTPEKRYEAFEQAVRLVYASSMNEEALTYRVRRGLVERDEQMALLIQRVSGDYHGNYFFPHMAGVGYSTNLYVWDKNVDMNAGMLRLVFGLGTRAVNRVDGDYPRIVCLDNPLRTPPVAYGDRQKFSQHKVDLLSLQDNTLENKNLEDVLACDLKTDSKLFVEPDYERINKMRESGSTITTSPYLLNFNGLFKNTDFAVYMRDMLHLLAKSYDYPVDIEFTVNFTPDGRYKVNLLQCRPLQTRGLGKAVALPGPINKEDCFFYTRGNFMGGNIRLPLDYVVYINPKPYLGLKEQDKYAVARQIGVINTVLKGEHVMLISPGRLGTTTPSLGVPVHFNELCNMSVICEVASPEAGLVPELSYGTHFFQDLVETGIFYAAIFVGDKDVVFNPKWVLKRENILTSLSPKSAALSGVIHVAKTEGLVIFSDITTQTLLCK